MGRAMLASWLRQGVPPGQITVIQNGDEKIAVIEREFGVDVTAKPDQRVSDAGVLVFAVKPQTLPELLPLYKPLLSKETLVVSVAAGKKLSFYTNGLGATVPVVRAMPNLPCLIGKGVTGLSPNEHVTPKQEMQAERLFSLMGGVVWLRDENKMHALTAISGSGPAYIFYFMQLMIESAVRNGLDRKQAETLVRTMIDGSVTMANESEESLEELRKGVTSPGGTTAAALEIFIQNEALSGLIDKAVKAAIRRGKELE